MAARYTRRVVIPLIDVKAQYAQLIPELKQRFAEVEAFERESAAYLDVPHAIGVANGTDALVLSLEAMGIGAGDEVICPSFTFYATSEAIARVGATPVFADIDPVSLNLDPEDVAGRITAKTKAIMPVHLFGRPVSLASFAALGVPLQADIAVGQHDLDAQHQIARIAKAQYLHPASIGRQIASNHARTLGTEAEGKEPVVARSRLLNRLQDATRLHSHGVTDRVDIQHVVHAAER